MITCFLVDDDHDDHDFFKMAVGLIDPAITIHFAENGLIALKMLDSLAPKPDVIFLDLNMPVMGGLEFLEELNKTVYKNIPVIVYSTSDERFFKQKALECGAVSYLPKAFNMKTLKEGIKNELEQLSLL